MKKKKPTPNNNLATAAIAAVVSLVIVLVFAGGSLTGNAATANYALTANVVATVDCNLANGTTLAFGDISQGGAAASDPNVTVQNDGSAAVDIVIKSSGTIDAFLGASGGSSLEATVSVESGSATNQNVSTSNQQIVDELVATDATDEATINFVLTAGSDATAGLKSGTNVVLTCSQD
tara:strand:- start:1074 stop:1607 length:534 start_codon:yes stop_codon:yes gene_type:complete